MCAPSHSFLNVSHNNHRMSVDRNKAQPVPQDTDMDHYNNKVLQGLGNKVLLVGSKVLLGPQGNKGLPLALQGNKVAQKGTNKN